MKKQKSLDLIDRPADDLVGAIMAFVTPPLAAIFAERSRNGHSPDILAEAIWIRIKRLAQARPRQPDDEQVQGGRDTPSYDRKPPLRGQSGYLWQLVIVYALEGRLAS